MTVGGTTGATGGARGETDGGAGAAASVLICASGVPTALSIGPHCPAKRNVIGMSEQIRIAGNSVVGVKVDDDQSQGMRCHIEAHPVDSIWQQYRYAVARS